MDHAELPQRVGWLVLLAFGAGAPATAQQTYFKAPNTEAGDAFGTSMAVSGNTLVIGTQHEESAATGIDGDPDDNSAPGSGAAYVYVRDGSGWAFQTYLKASNTEAGDWFGESVAISGDRIVVGASGESSSATGVGGNQSDNGASSAGAAYVFVRSGETWIQEAYLKASNAEEDDAFGISVGISGDTIVVSAGGEASDSVGVNGDQDNNNKPESGAAYVFTRQGGVWTQQAYLKSPSPDDGDDFGDKIGLSGETIVIGASAEASDAVGVNGDPTNNNRPDSGAAYVYVRNGETWSLQAYLKASNPDAGDLFGLSVAVSADTVVVGAANERSNSIAVNGNQSDNSSVNTGAAYVFARNGSDWTQEAYLKASNPEPFDSFGEWVATSGNAVVVGASQEDGGATGVNGNAFDNGSNDSGAAYVYVRTGANWSLRAYLKASNTDPVDRFGGSLAFADGTVFVAAPSESSSATGVGGDQNNNDEEYSGAVYAFDLIEIAEDLDLDLSETTVLEPGEQAGDETEDAYVTTTNLTGGDDATITVKESEVFGPEASGFGVFGVNLTVDTSLSDGEFLMTLTLPFDAEQIGGANPLLVDLAYLEASTGRWELAVSGNTVNSPGFGSPEGDRFAAQGLVIPSPAVPSSDLGDYGVFWNTATQRGYAWANVDHTTEFKLGLKDMIELGCGLNPVASLAPTNGPPELGATLVLALDDPPGSSPNGSLAFLMVSLAPDPNFPCGTQLPGYGMTVLNGELLVSVAPPNPVAILGPEVWASPGVPANLSIPVPNDLTLLGIDLFLQGVLASASTIRFTDGLQITLGG